MQLTGCGRGGEVGGEIRQRTPLRGIQRHSSRFDEVVLLTTAGFSPIASEFAISLQFPQKRLKVICGPIPQSYSPEDHHVVIGELGSRTPNKLAHMRLGLIR